MVRRPARVCPPRRYCARLRRRRRRHNPLALARERTPPPSPLRAPAAAGGADGDAPRAAAALIPTSPRSVEACFRLGLDPLDLVHRPASAFKRPGEPPELAAKRHAHHEQLRQARARAPPRPTALGPPATPRARPQAPATARLRHDALPPACPAAR